VKVCARQSRFRTAANLLMAVARAYRPVRAQRLQTAPHRILAGSVPVLMEGFFKAPVLARSQLS